MASAGADIIAFAGGDGSARDIYNAIGESLPVLGIPAGVKIHSPVYAQTPEKAGELLHLFLSGQTTLTREAEVLDINEEDYRRDVINTNLYGYLRIPFERRFMQGGKAPSPMSEKSQQLSIAGSLAQDMDQGTFYLVGPGSTTRCLMEYLKTDNTLLGVDLLLGKKTVAKDLSEHEILSHINERPAKLIITPTGGQGYLLGRGNQQISPEVIKKLGKKNIIVAATIAKLAGLFGQPLLVDTGDAYADELLRGYVKVVTGYRQASLYRVE
jgi:predicted polyphosphate/ATP-dependent NAD kinase